MSTVTKYSFHLSILSYLCYILCMEDYKIVLLIDADNTQLSKLGGVIQELSTYGRIVVKRAYGNWKKITLKNWEGELKRLAIKAEQQFDYVSGKNATDMALAIDTMDLLHTDNYDAFAIVASDSDYTPLAIRLHEEGIFVIGVGEKKTPEPFRNACDEFIFLENLDADSERNEDNKENYQGRERSLIDEVHRLLARAGDKYEDEDGFTRISQAGEYIKRVKPDFDVRTYGYKKLSDLISAFPKKYETRREKSSFYYRCRY